jgi:hypothetical protein
MYAQGLAKQLHNGIPDSTPFLGGQEELIEIAGRLTDPNCRLVTLVGIGGIDKTRLALRTAHQLAIAFTDGIWWSPSSLSTRMKR